ncbi:MAG: hypothetical protein ACLUUO_02755 [Sellimonas intestinalis]
MLKDSVSEDEEKSEELFDILGEPMLLAEGLSSDSDELGAMKDQMMAQMPQGAVPEDATIFDISGSCRRSREMRW